MGATYRRRMTTPDRAATICVSTRLTTDEYARLSEAVKIHNMTNPPTSVAAALRWTGLQWAEDTIRRTTTT